MFLEGSEMFISAILASRMKINTLNYDTDLENIHLKLPVSPFWSLFEFSKKNLVWGIYSKYFSNWSDVKNSPDLNVLERVLIAVKFLLKNIEKQKSYPRFPKKLRHLQVSKSPPMDCEAVL